MKNIIKASIIAGVINAILSFSTGGSLAGIGEGILNAGKAFLIAGLITFVAIILAYGYK